MVLMLALAFLFVSCVQIERNNPDDPGSNDYTGTRTPISQVVSGPSVTYEGETYETVVIGKQTWFKRNLNYAVEGSECYDNEEDNCTIYGRLYDWETAKSVCPDGWHTPSDAEWGTLMKFLNPSCADNSERVCAGVATKLKAKSGWNYYNGKSDNGIDTYGFAALPGGVNDSGVFLSAGYNGYWWSSSEHSTDFAYNRSMNYNSEDVSKTEIFKSSLFSVRCLKD